jgi:DNA-binding transcriptional MerR regulator
LLNGATETGFGIFEDGGINGYGTTRMYWQAGGNIGVGTTTPTYKMHVLGDIYANGGWMRVSGNNGLYFESWGGGFYMSDATWVRINNNKNLYTAATMQADASMNSSVFNFGYWDIADPAQVDGQLFRTGGQAVIEVDDWLYVRDNDNNNRIQFNTDQGAVYTGSGNSIYMLSQSGKFQQAANFNFAANGVLLENNISESGGIQANGDNVNIWSPGDADLVRFYDEDGMILRSYINASGNYFSTSDIRKKENILKIDNGLDKVLQLNGYLYNYKLHAEEIKKGDVPRQTAGVMIQEVQKVMPELVDDKGEEGLYLNYDGMVPYLIEAIKAQQEQIDALNKKIEELQKN